MDSDHRDYLVTQVWYLLYIADLINMGKGNTDHQWLCLPLEEFTPWRRHIMEAFSLALLDGNPPYTGGSPSQKPSIVDVLCFL